MASRAMSLPTISVVMPNHNHGHYIEEALRALVEQSVSPRELIVVDDASTDDSIARITPFTRRYPFVKLVRNEKNLGAFQSLQIGSASATGDYLYCPAADDKVLPGFFEKSLSLLARHPRAGFCCTLARMLGLEGEDLGPYHTPIVSDVPRYFSPEEILSLYERHGAWFVTFSAIYRRSAFLELGGYDLGVGPAADSVLNHILSRRYGACFVPEPLVCWRKSDDGVAGREARDASSVLAVIDAVAGRLQRPDSRDLFPASYMRMLWRQAVFGLLYELSRRYPDRNDQFEILLRRLPNPALLDKIFLAGLRTNLVGPRAMKLYLFLRQPPEDQHRIAVGKLRGFFGV